MNQAEPPLKPGPSKTPITTNPARPSAPFAESEDPAADIDPSRAIGAAPLQQPGDLKSTSPYHMFHTLAVDGPGGQETA